MIQNCSRNCPVFLGMHNPLKLLPWLGTFAPHPLKLPGASHTAAACWIEQIANFTPAQNATFRPSVPRVHSRAVTIWPRHVRTEHASTTKFGTLWMQSTPVTPHAQVWPVSRAWPVLPPTDARSLSLRVPTLFWSAPSAVLPGCKTTRSMLACTRQCGMCMAPMSRTYTYRRSSGARTPVCGAHMPIRGAPVGWHGRHCSCTGAEVQRGACVSTCCLQPIPFCTVLLVRRPFHPARQSWHAGATFCVHSRSVSSHSGHPQCSCRRAALHILRQ